MSFNPPKLFNNFNPFRAIFSSLRIVKSSSFILVFLASVKSPVFIVFFIKFLVSFSILKFNFTEYLTALNILVGSSIKLKLCKTLIFFSSKSLNPFKRSIKFPKQFLLIQIARVLIVKSLLNKSSFIFPPISTLGKDAGSL